MIVGIAGYAQSGKDTVADMLVEHHGFHKIGFAARLKAMLLEVDPLVPAAAFPRSTRLSDYVAAEGWDEAKKLHEVRRLLQCTGMACRSIDEDFWVNALFDVVDELHESVVIPDVRFPNELRRIRAAGGVVWRVVRPGFGPINAHVSETAIERMAVEVTLDNSRSLAFLRVQVETALATLTAHT